MKLVLNIIAIITNIIYSLIMLFSAFFLSASLFGVEPTSGEVTASYLITLTAIAIIILSCFIPKYKYAQVVVLGLVTIFSIYYLILLGSSDYPAILGVYLIINIPIITYRFLKL